MKFGHLVARGLDRLGYALVRNDEREAERQERAHLERAVVRARALRKDVIASLGDKIAGVRARAAAQADGLTRKIEAERIIRRALKASVLTIAADRDALARDNKALRRSLEAARADAAALRARLQSGSEAADQASARLRAKLDVTRARNRQLKAQLNAPAAEPAPQVKELSKRRSLTRMRDLGIAPGTLFDVGVATGTPAIYGIFPGVRLVLIEPLAESLPAMQRIVEEHPGAIAINAAAGHTEGEGLFVVDEGLSGSSFMLNPKQRSTRRVPMVTIDGVVRDHALEGPYVLKLDVQGFELAVLTGAEQTLRRTEAVIVEASLWSDRKQGGLPRILDLMAWLGQQGFVLYDIGQIVRRQTDDAITEIDLVFCPEASPLRTVAAYKTPVQRQALIEKRRRAFGLERVPQKWNPVLR